MAFNTTTTWKGKQKAEDFAESDINPTITYRHLHSQSSQKDPLRVIALCDSDAFYAACEMVRLKSPRDVPLVVLQWESFIAVNYAARKYGISRFGKGTKEEAKKACPELVCVHVATYKEGQDAPGYWDNVDSRTHKVSLDYYRRESAKILQLFKELLPGAEIEKASIDEAFFDLTKPVREMILGRYPHLATVPKDAPEGLDTPLPPPPKIGWEGLGTIVHVNPDGQVAPADGNTENDLEDSTPTWHDVALSIGAELVNKVRREVDTRLGYTTSAGIARNKFLAKLCASYRKPDGQSTLRNSAIPNYLRPMAFQKIRFLGGKLGEAMAEEYEVSTIGDMLSVSLEEMQRKFGDNAIWVYEVLRGIDRSEVKAKPALNKSMLASKNLQKPITMLEDGAHWIRVLASELALRLNTARLEASTLWPKTIVLHARQGNDSRSKQAPFPFVKAVTVDLIAAAGDRLWKELMSASTFKVNSVQLAFTGLETAETGQKSIDSFLNGAEASGSSLKRQREDETDDEEDADSFFCSRCGKRILIPATSSSGISDPLDGHAERRTALLTSLRAEHSDFHFALDLSRQPVEVETISTKGKKKKKKREEEPGSIANYFVRK